MNLKQALFCCVVLLLSLTSAAQTRKFKIPQAIRNLNTIKVAERDSVEFLSPEERDSIDYLSSSGGKYVANDSTARFVVLNAKHNGMDITPWAIENGVFTVFYNSGEQPCMANVCQGGDSQSWGPIYNISEEKFIEHLESGDYDAEEYKFLWNYKNTYDDKSGTCQVTFKKTYQPQGVVSVLKMETGLHDVTEYTGYMDGTLDFSKIDAKNPE